VCLHVSLPKLLNRFELNLILLVYAKIFFFCSYWPRINKLKSDIISFIKNGLYKELAQYIKYRSHEPLYLHLKHFLMC
jgi:hypothetical protein